MTSREQTRPFAGWLGPLRESVRSTFFGVVRQVFQTDDGRRILTEALRGATGQPPPFVPSQRDVLADIYSELGRSVEQLNGAPAPLFISGRFRSGSTLLWNLFRHIPNCRSYYEPLNERRWFDPTRRGNNTDPTHLGVSDYWREYEGLEKLGAVFRDDWGKRNLYMDAFCWDPDMKAYIQGLIDAAAPDRAVLQFNRVDFRLPWLRRTFPHARVLHLYRHPRDQWCSSLVNPRSFPKDAQAKDFAPCDHFYLLAWARDLRYVFPFLDESRVAHPYQLFYYIWKLSWLFGRRYADCSVEFERLLKCPALEVPRLLAGIGMQEADISQLDGLIVDQPTDRWRAYADEEWFTRHEECCEVILRDFFGKASAADSSAQALGL